MTVNSVGLTDRSGTITLGGTAQVAASANSGRQFLLLQNIDGSEDLWVRLTGTAAVDGAGSIRLGANASLHFEGEVIASSQISVIAATTGHKFTLWEG